MKRWISVLLIFAMVLPLAACSGSTGNIDQGEYVCTLEIRCDTLLPKLSELEPGKAALVPADGVILAETEVHFDQGDSVYDVLRKTLRQKKIHFEATDASIYNSVYIEGIGNLYEFDGGPQSGWMYSVNGVYPGLGCSSYTLSDGDKIVFRYTCDIGADIGADYQEGTS